MEITIESPPRTMMEVYEMLPEGTLAELIDNQLYMSPAPNFPHQLIAKTILKKLDKIVEDTDLGTVIISPFDVKLDKTRNAVQPDLVVILKRNPNQVGEKGPYHGIPDLLVEVLSDGNKDHDLITKKDLYEKFGVKEYWVIDPETKLAIGFALSGDSYKKISDEIGKIKSPLLNAEFLF
jgi:Uma2 family endonuclease